MSEFNFISVDELEHVVLDGVTAGTVTANRAVVVGADRNIDTIAIADGGLKLGAGAGTAVVPTAAKINLLTQGIAAGYKVARGETSITGSAAVATGLATVVAVVASLAEDAALACLFVTGALSGTAGEITLKAWKPTSAADVTPLAATVAKKVDWIAIGT